MKTKTSRLEAPPKRLITPDRLKFLAERNATALENPAAVELRSKLLEHAGEEVLLRMTTEEIDRLLARVSFILLKAQACVECREIVAISMQQNYI